MRHIAFRASRKMFERAQQELAQRGIDFELEDHDTAHSIYFHDPDGHELEITTYDVETRESLYRRALEAFNRGDRDEFVAVWHEDCEYRPGLESNFEGSGAVFHGHAGVLGWWDRLHQELVELSAHVEEFHELGDRALGIIEFRARGVASGAATTARVAQLATYRDGKIASVQDFFDVEQGKRAAGL